MLSNMLATTVGLNNGMVVIGIGAGTSGTSQLAYFVMAYRKTWYFFVAAPC